MGLLFIIYNKILVNVELRQITTNSRCQKLHEGYFSQKIVRALDREELNTIGCVAPTNPPIICQAGQ
jgi:hypothetical protein